MVHAEKKSLTVSKLDRIPIEDMIRPPLIPIVRHTRPNPTFQPSLPSIQSYNHHSTYNRPTQPSHQQDLDRLPLSCSYPSNGPLGIYCFHHGASLVPGLYLRLPESLDTLHELRLPTIIRHYTAFVQDKYPRMPALHRYHIYPETPIRTLDKQK